MGRAVWGGEGGSPMGPYWPSSMPRRTSTWVSQSTAMKPAVMAKKSIDLQQVNQGWTLLALHHPADAGIATGGAHRPGMDQKGLTPQPMA